MLKYLAKMGSHVLTMAMIDTSAISANNTEVIMPGHYGKKDKKKKKGSGKKRK